MKKIMTVMMIVLLFGFYGVSQVMSSGFNCASHCGESYCETLCQGAPMGSGNNNNDCNTHCLDYCVDNFPCPAECPECTECPDVDCGDVTVEGGDLTSICRNYCAPDIDCGDVTVVGGDLKSICSNFCMQINVCDIECGDLDCSDLYCPEVTSKGKSIVGACKEWRI